MPRVAVNAVVDLPLPRHFDKGEQCGNDGLFVHNSLFFYTFRAAKLQKVIRKSLGETKKKVAEGKSLKLVSVF